MTTKRRTREQWLKGALEVLAEQGPEHLKVRVLSIKMGVTTGSYYYHFKNRRDFIKSLAQYWAETSTREVVEKMSAIEGSGEERLLALMKIIDGERYIKFDLPMRAWALLEPEVAKVVRKVDKTRLGYVESIFNEMGFHGAEMKLRAHTFAAYHSLRGAFLAKEEKKGGAARLIRRHAFFTRK